MKQCLWGLLYRYQHPSPRPRVQSYLQVLTQCLPPHNFTILNKFLLYSQGYLYYESSTKQMTSYKHTTDFKETYWEEDPGDGKDQDNFTRWKHWWLHSTFIAVGGFECQPTHWSMNANCGPKHVRKQSTPRKSPECRSTPPGGTSIFHLKSL